MRSLAKTLVISLALVLVATGAFAAKKKSDVDIPVDEKNMQMAGENPLQGLELDLAFLDAMTAMLHLNNVLLQQVKLSSDCSWPDRLEVPANKTPEEQVYHAWIDDQMKKDFSFYKYYGDWSVNDFLTFKGATERPVIEASQLLVTNLVHQRQVIDYCPNGCGNPPIFGKAITKDCGKIRKKYAKACGFFSQPLEDQISVAFLKKHEAQYVTKREDPRCLTMIKAKTHAYNSFEQAFVALLDQGYVQEYGDLVKEYETQNRATMGKAMVVSNLEGKKEALEDKIDANKDRIAMLGGKANFSFGSLFGGDKPKEIDPKIAKMSEAQRTKEITRLEAENKALKDQIKTKKAEIKVAEKALKKQEKVLDKALDAYKDFLDDATKKMDVTPEKAQIAAKMLKVAEAVDSNLTTVLVGVPVVLTKCGVDVCYVAASAPLLTQLPMVLAQEIKNKDKVKSGKDALRLAKKRIDLAVTRSLTLVPNLFNMGYQVYAQSDLLGPKIDYIEEVIDAGKDLKS